jgi:NitT/TauT family transport system substrate-binding protein
MEYVNSHTAKEIAEVIAPQFSETDTDTIATIVDRYLQQNTWKTNLVFEKDGFELLEEILMEAGELDATVPYEDLVNTTYANEAK